MPLKPVVDSIDDVEEGQRALYVEGDDGKFRLDVEGGVASSTEVQELRTKIREFRDTNVSTMKERDALKAAKAELEGQLAKLEGIDPDEYKTLKAKVESLGSKGVKSVEDLTSLVEQAVEKHVGPLREEVKSERTRREESEKALRERELISKLTDAAIKAGVRQTALQDVINRGRSVYQFDESGKIVPKRSDGGIWYDGDDPIALPAYMQHLATTEAPHCFKESNGSDATGGTRNPRVRQLIDPSPAERGKYMKEIAEGKIEVVNTTGANR